MKTYKIKLIVLLMGMALAISLNGMDKIKISESIYLDLELAARGYAVNDQRIYWSGMEFTFGSEAAIRAELEKKITWGRLGVETELYLNQPFGKNILLDEGREKFHPNFIADTLELSQLNVFFQTNNGNLTLRFGKGESPFGRYSFPVFFNNKNYGAPFIRSEAILWRETGLFIRFKTGILSFDVAAVNGEENRDTNSGKAGVFRFGLEGRNWRIGASMKEHDGYGSEWQKLYRNHVGLDLMLKIASVEFSGEVIWDEYGFHREFDPADIFWPNSIYYREIFKAYKEPVEGFGWYGNIKVEVDRFLLNLNYGVYEPEELGNIYHDNTIRRFILKMAYTPIQNFRVYFSGVLENTKPEESWRQGAKGFAGLFGFEFSL